MTADEKIEDEWGAFAHANREVLGQMTSRQRTVMKFAYLRGALVAAVHAIEHLQPFETKLHGAMLKARREAMDAVDEEARTPTIGDGGNGG